MSYFEPKLLRLKGSVRLSVMANLSKDPPFLRGERAVERILDLAVGRTGRLGQLDVAQSRKILLSYSNPQFLVSSKISRPGFPVGDTIGIFGTFRSSVPR